MMANAAVPSYTPVGYLQNVKGVQQWIDTGVCFDPAESWLIEAESTAITGYRSIICSSYADASRYGISLEWYTSRIPRSYLVSGNGASVDLKGDGHSTATKLKPCLLFDPDEKKLTLSADGKVYQQEFNIGVLPGSLTLCMFMDHRASPATVLNQVSIYSLKITRAGTLIRDFIPVLDKDGVPCMYDKANRKFYYNQGTGQFTYGEE
jgi:hypothetical protein